MLTRTINYAKELLLDDYDYSGFEIAAKAYDAVNPESQGYNKEKKFVDKFYLGFTTRPSVKESMSPQNAKDNAIDAAMKGILSDIESQTLEFLHYAHRAEMAAESIIGLMILEYLHARLREYGWSICWGNCLYGIDLCSEKGVMVHIRNKSTTEVSANDRNRIGKNVYKWFRLNARNGKTKWEDLNLIVGKIALLSEEDFLSFVNETIKKNPYSLYIGSDEIEKLKGLYSKVFGA